MNTILISNSKMDSVRSSMNQSLPSEASSSSQYGDRDFIELISDLKSLRRKQAFSEQIIGSIVSNVLIYLSNKKDFLLKTKTMIDLRANLISITSKQLLTFIVKPFPTVPNPSEILTSAAVLYQSPQMNSNDGNTMYQNDPLNESIWQVGILAFELACNKTPWDQGKSNDSSKMEKIASVCKFSRISAP